VKPLRVKQAKGFGKVAVLMGGNAAEREISIKSGLAVFKSLEKQGLDVVAIDVKDCVIEVLAGKEIDRIFNIIHGRGGEDGVLQGVLEVMNIPYTGSGVMASSLTMDKLRTKLCWQGAGLKTPKWFVLNTEQEIERCIDRLGFPVIVKPAQEGSSIGMSKASNRDELKQALLMAENYQCDVLVEAWVEGNEYTVAILDGEALAVIRLETANEFYDFEAKYQSDSTQYHCPCGLSLEQESRLKQLAVEACQVVDVKGWGRVDIFIDHQGQSQLIEVNTVPGMTDHSLVPMAAKVEGCDFDELVWRILETTVND